jgi:hypothetical protein
MRAPLLVLLLAGCIVHVPIDRPQLERLDGYGSTPRAYPFVDREGYPHELDDQTPLYLVDVSGQRSGGTFKSVKVDAQTFSGQLLDGSRLELALDALDHGEIDHREVSGPVMVGLAVVLAAAASLLVGVMAMNGLP